MARRKPHAVIGEGHLAAKCQQLKLDNMKLSEELDEEKESVVRVLKQLDEHEKTISMMVNVASAGMTEAWDVTKIMRKRHRNAMRKPLWQSIKARVRGWCYWALATVGVG